MSGTRPFDGAPGGWRGSMADMDAVPAPFGDIVALHPNHCFIPTISSLALNNTTNLFYDVAGDPSLLSHTPFDAVYFPSTNLEHIEVTAESVHWFLDELEQGLVAVPCACPPAMLLPRLGAWPNPFETGTRILLSLAADGPVAVGVYSVDGRQVRSLANGRCPRALRCLTGTRATNRGECCRLVSTPCASRPRPDRDETPDQDRMTGHDGGSWCSKV